jgi:dihydroorotase
MSKFLNMGMPLPDIILRSTWNPAKEIHHEELGNLSVGSVANISVFSVETENLAIRTASEAGLKATENWCAN